MKRLGFGEKVQNSMAILEFHTERERETRYSPYANANLLTNFARLLVSIAAVHEAAAHNFDVKRRERVNCETPGGLRG